MPAPAATVSFALQVGAAETFFQESGMQPVFADPVAPLPIMPAAWLPSLTTAYRQRARTLRQFQNAIGGHGAWRQGHRPHRQDPGTDLCGDCRFGHQHTNRGWWTLGRAAWGTGSCALHKVPCRHSRFHYKRKSRFPQGGKRDFLHTATVSRLSSQPYRVTVR